MLSGSYTAQRGATCRSLSTDDEAAEGNEADTRNSKDYSLLQSIFSRFFLLGRSRI